VLTFDIEWVPDFVLDDISSILIKRKIKTTWFITHNSPGVQRLLSNDLFEFGIHPNFMENSTQGKTKEEVMDYLKKIFPYANIMRTHGLYQSTDLLSMAEKKFGIDTDVSLFLPNTAFITPHKIYLSENSKGLLRIPYFWEDDIEAYNPSKDWRFDAKRYHKKGLKIFNFHPLYVYLNCNSMYSYNNLKRSCNIQNSEKLFIDRFVNNNERGIKDFFIEFVDYLQYGQSDTYTIFDIKKAWAVSNEDRSNR